MKTLLAILIGFVAGYVLAPVPGVNAPEIKVFTRTDTVRVTVPEVLVVRAKNVVQEQLALVSDTTDSVEVKVPVQQTVYRGDAYRAVVSGFMTSLDTVEIFQSVTTVTQRYRSNQRVSIGLQGGYGFTPKGFQPYIGIGITVRIL